jgi:feruloyl esterase
MTRTVVGSLVLCILLGGASVDRAQAAGVVGTGTAASCTDAALNTALAGGGLVTFNCGSAAIIDVSLGTGTKTIDADTQLDGDGQITISGGDQVPILVVNPGVALTVESLSLTHSAGSAIANFRDASVTVINSTFADNTAYQFDASGAGAGGSGDYNGGALRNMFGTLTVTSSRFMDNVALAGGAISSIGTLTVTASSFSRNDAGSGGAIFIDEGTGAISNSTFADNSARSFSPFCNSGTGDGGAIHAFASVITNSTFLGNSADCRGGTIFSRASSGLTVVLRNTIVAGDCSGTIEDGGHNIGSSTCGFSTANGSFNIDPELDPAGLRDNGGPTETIALCRTVGIPAGCTGASRAIDAGDPGFCADAPVNGVDQRGFARPGANHSACSIGAYEGDLFLPVATATSTQTITATPPVSATPTPTHTPEIAMCVGDCDGNRVVEVSNLILGVNIALDRQPLSACEAFANAQGVVDVAQLVKGVNNALHGCGSTPRTECEALNNRTLGGAQISFARLVPSSASYPEYCKVLGTFPPKTNFEVRLPTSWNGRALFMGDVALGGSIPPAEDIRDFLFTPSIPTGYATIGTDGGHQADLGDGSWALDDAEAVRTLYELAIHTVLGAAREIIATRYGQPAAHAYFMGHSTGGTQGLIEAQRWPDDFDGIVVLAPSNDETGFELAANRVGQQVFGVPGARLSPAKVATLAQATLAACDDLDGLADGIISHAAACQFDPANLRCTGPDNDQCLTDVQIDTVNLVHSDLMLDFALANGIRSYPGWPIGHEFVPLDEPRPGGWPFWITGTTADPRSSGIVDYADQVLRFLVTHNATLDTLHFSPNDHQAELQAYSAFADGSDPDLSAFAARGGKLIFWQGLADCAASPRATIRYYEEVVRTAGGQAAADDFVRFYTSPGVGHFNDGPGAGTTDFLSAITAWVETGAAPADLVSSRLGPGSSNPLLTRPLCRYPGYPRYNGEGDPADAASFHCEVNNPPSDIIANE